MSTFQGGRWFVVRCWCSVQQEPPPRSDVDVDIWTITFEPLQFMMTWIFECLKDDQPLNVTICW